MTTHDERHVLLTSYMQDEFQMMIDSAIESMFPTKGVTAEVTQTSWEIRTTSPVVYSPGGWYEDIHKEKISHIAVMVNFRVNGMLKGTPQPIKFTPSQQFYNLREVVGLILSSTDRTKQGLEMEDEYSLDNIESRRYTVHEIDTSDYRVVHLTGALIQMGKSEKTAHRIALDTIKQYPTTHRLELLLEIAIAPDTTDVNDEIDEERII